MCVTSHCSLSSARAAALTVDLLLLLRAGGPKEKKRAGGPKEKSAPPKNFVLCYVAPLAQQCACSGGNCRPAAARRRAKRKKRTARHFSLCYVALPAQQCASGGGDFRLAAAARRRAKRKKRTASDLATAPDVDCVASRTSVKTQWRLNHQEYS